MSALEHGILAATAVVATAALAVGLGRTDLWPPDEPRVAEISREMWVDGSWLVPTLNGEPFTEEPPLFYWLQACAYRAAGRASTVAARVPAAAAAILGVAATAGVALSTGASPLVAAVVLATAPEYWWMARSATPDTAAATAATVALGAFFVAWRTGRRSLLAATVVALGAAFWCKSLLPVGLAVVTMALFVGTAGWGAFRARDVALAAAGAAALGTVWVVVLANRLGLAEAEFFLITNHFGRLAGLPVEGHVRSVLYYFTNLALDCFPWSLALPAAFAAAWRGRAAPERRFALCWTGGMLLVLTLSASKRAHYLLAAYPGFALLIAHWWPDAWRGILDRVSRRLMIGALSIVGPIVALVLLSVRTEDVMAVGDAAPRTVAGWMMMLRALPASGPGWLAAAGLALLGIVVLRADWTRSVARGAAALGAYATCVHLLLTVAVLPRIDPLCSARPGAERLGRLADRGVRVVAYGFTGSGALSPVLFYAGRLIPEMKHVQDLRSELRAGPACAVIRPGDYAALASVLPGSPVPSGTLPGFRLVIVESTPGLCSGAPEGPGAGRTA